MSLHRACCCGGCLANWRRYSEVGSATYGTYPFGAAYLEDDGPTPQIIQSAYSYSLARTGVPTVTANVVHVMGYAYLPTSLGSPGTVISSWINSRWSPVSPLGSTGLSPPVLVSGYAGNTDTTGTVSRFYFSFWTTWNVANWGDNGLALAQSMRQRAGFLGGLSAPGGPTQGFYTLVHDYRSYYGGPISGTNLAASYSLSHSTGFSFSASGDYFFPAGESFAVSEHLVDTVLEVAPFELPGYPVAVNVCGSGGGALMASTGSPAKVRRFSTADADAIERHMSQGRREDCCG